MSWWKCIEGKYFNSDDLSCSKCPKNWKTCSADDKWEEWNYFDLEPKEDGQLWQCKKEAHYFDDNEKRWYPCSNNCSKCKSKETWTEWVNPTELQLFDDSCFCRESNHFYDKINNKCLPWDPKCNTCEGYK